jgi:hypothetical protein
MAESVVFAEETFSTIKKLKITVTSAADGTATGTSKSSYSGEVLRFVTVPASDGTQPSDDFDVVLDDEDGYDILAGNGANLSNAAATTVVSGMGAIANDKITFDASNMGDSKAAVFYVYLR